MTRTACVLLGLFFLSACVKLPPNGIYTKKVQSALNAAAQCKQNQYWDGTTCRHKGKGSGARKHDGK